VFEITKEGLIPPPSQAMYIIETNHYFNTGKCKYNTKHDAEVRTTRQRQI